MLTLQVTIYLKWLTVSNQHQITYLNELDSIPAFSYKSQLIPWDIQVLFLSVACPSLFPLLSSYCSPFFHYAFVSASSPLSLMRLVFSLLSSRLVRLCQQPGRCLQHSLLFLFPYKAAFILSLRLAVPASPCYPPTPPTVFSAFNLPAEVEEFPSIF